ncbi:hypothetical protein EST38_g6333 [Candolleomyces aberdarensis]|uniref:Uncharacterized protein n=1 Tax=Candolleomyces aberdarensis TaxID=2316362 RepID=A0A4Q2DHU9_9AGAR|nr:hypothetical protein EST38_g6333 [Candolleomyces aberdarensis]
MLPLLSAPSPALHLHASNALSALHPPTEELPPQLQLRALLYCTRWEAGIDPRDLLSDALEGERWLVWAAGNAEEVPAALLLAHAALLSSMRKRSYRRAGLWYVTAARRLEKCGIAPVSSLSLEDGDGFASEDKSYLDDFRVAFAHMQSTEPETISTLNLTIPLKFCQPKQCKIRFPGESTLGDASIWERREEEWRAFQKSTGSKQLLVASKKVCANEYFWVDLALSNPLAAEVNLSNVTLAVETKHTGEAGEPLVDVEVVQEVVLSPKETRNIPIALKCSKPSSIIVSAAKFDFLALLSVTESLSHRGRRLHDTQAQRITPTYAPDVQLKIDVAPAQSKLAPSFVEEGPLILKQGETRELGLWLLNAGDTAVQEIWVLTGSEHEVWLGDETDDVTTSSKTEIIRSSNSLRASEPQKVSLAQALLPNEGTNVSVSIHGQQLGTHELLLFFAYRESDSTPFHSARLGRSFEVQPLLDVEVSLQPSRSSDHSFVLNVEMTSSLQSSSLRIKQISTISPSWKLKPIFNSEADLAPSQLGRFTFGAEQWLDGEGKEETLEFVSKKLDDVLLGNIVTPSDPPEIDLVCSHLLETPTSQTRTFHSGSLQTFLHSGRRIYSSDVAAQQHPHIPSESYPYVFPLYNPLSVDVIIFWEVPSQKLQGHIAVYGTKAGAAHAALNDILDKAENSKVKRSMYAETVREKKELFDGIRNSEWNAEMDPISVSIQDVGQIEHDFSKGPCHVPLSFLVRNHSPLFDSRVTLKLRGRNSEQSHSDLLYDLVIPVFQAHH